MPAELRWLAVFVVAWVTGSLAACDTLTVGRNRSRIPGPFETIQNIDILPRFPERSGSASKPPQAPQGASYFGHDDTLYPVQEQPPGATPAPDGKGYQLNFEKVPIEAVAKAVIGDLLGKGYTIDSRIQGTVTMSSARPVSRSDLLFVLENALRMSNVVLLPDASGYRLVPLGDAVGGTGVSPRRRAEAGYGLTVVPLRFVSAKTVLKLLDNFAIKPGGARVLSNRNLILIRGTGDERRTAMRTILSFDVDWMRGQSVGIYPLQSAAPEAIIAELEKVMKNGDGELNHDLVKFQPISRLNAVMVVTKRSRLLRAAAMWIKRLDRSNSAAAGVRVYRLRYASAKQVARLLNEIFGRQSSSDLNAPANEIAPGAGLVSSTSGAAPSGPLYNNQQRTGLAPPSTVTANASNSGGPLVPAQSRLTSRGAVAGERGQPDQPTSVNLPGIRIAADEANNSLLIFANQENYRLIERTVRQLDRPQLQVAIHATIAEVTLNNDLRYGVQYFLKSNDLGLGKDKGSSMLTNNIVRDAISRVLPGYNLLIGPEADPRAILDALRSVTDVKVLSTPSVVVIDNQVATLQVGDEVPIATQSATILTNPNTPLVNTIDYRNTGVILRVLPRINVNGNVILDIEQEISNVSKTSSADTLTPTVSQRKIKSSIAVASGQSVLLGGLISERQDRGRFGIPVLEEIPYIGDIFARNTRNTERTELVIFIQPQIIRDSVDAYKIAEELRAKLRGSVEAAFPPGPTLRRDPYFVR